MDVQPVASALIYFDHGWPPLPLPTGAKFPPPDGLTGHTGVDLTRDEVAALAWSGNIGIRMPADVLGIDVDVYHKGDATLAALIRTCGRLPPTWITHSGRDDGSGIRFYRVPAGMSWIASLPGIEIIQRGHRYAVVWPSIHPDGRRYGWWEQAEGGPVADVPLVDDLPDLPWPWVAELSRANSADVDGMTRSVAATSEAVDAFVRGSVHNEAPSYVATIIKHFVERVAQGYARHDTMQHCLTWALECCAARLAYADKTIEALAEAWAQAVQPDARRMEVRSALRVTEFEAMVRHAVGKVGVKTTAELDRLHDDIAGIPMKPTPPPADVHQESPPVETVPVLTFGRLPDPFVLPPTEWHAQALLAKPTHGELAGAEKTLKTYTGLCLDVALAAGVPVFGRFDVPARQRVLLLVGEGGAVPWLRRMQAVCAAYGLQPGDIGDHVRFTSQTASVTSHRFIEGVRAELESFGPALVHLDPWYAYAGGQADARQVTEVGATLAALGSLCAEHGASLLINHHYNRAGAEGLRQITGAGHAEWVDSWLLVKHRIKADPGAGRYRLRLDVGSRQWGGNAYDLDFDINPLTERITWHIDEAADEPDDRAADRFAEVKLKLLRVGREARKAMTRAAWIARTEARDTDCRAAFDELVADGRVIEVATMRSGVHTVSTYQVSDP